MLAPGVNPEGVHLGVFVGAEIGWATSVSFSLSRTPYQLNLNGTDFVYDRDDQLVGGDIESLSYTNWTTRENVNIGGFHLSPGQAFNWLLADATLTALTTLLSGADVITGSVGADTIRGFDGNDSIRGETGSDYIEGGLGNDTISGWGFGSQPSERNYLRGDEGSDSVRGSSYFDDINGNMGNDTCAGASGSDWVVGGKDDDILYGDFAPGDDLLRNPSLNLTPGDDIVYGNMGNDTCFGGAGADIVRGGQGDDSVSGEAGADWLSGDRGNDTLAGGAGADTFNFFTGAGGDRVTDFNAAEGDKVRIEGGASYAVRQVGADTVVDIGGGDTLTLVGVNSSSLPAGWVFAA